MNLGVLSGLMHNGRMISNCEHILNDALKAGTYIVIENPDGTRVRLQYGCKIHSVEAIITTPGEPIEILNFNEKS